jgi:uncharacterized membrane-anchored protein YhcB (DUF1043 family)
MILQDPFKKKKKKNYELEDDKTDMEEFNSLLSQHFVEENDLECKLDVEMYLLD